MHAFILHNGQILPAASAVLFPGQVGLLSGWGVFSTLRVSDGVLFAWERHWARMQHDATLLRVPFPADPEPVRRSLLSLIEANQAYEATLRLVVVRNRGGIWEGPGLDRDYDVIGLTTTLKQWGEGTRLAVVPDARHGGSPFAGLKTLSWSMNLCWLEQAQSRGFDEALLLDVHGKVSECTSANIFIARGGRVLTPPLSSGCLPGVTRDVLLHEIRIPGITVEEQEFTIEDLLDADEVFITSTTRNLLPVLAVEEDHVPCRGDVHLRLSSAFSAFVDAYVAASAGATARRAG
ncbi:MAG TPA: aminotransferase class IV [Bryobacteraceae bacterium]|nr:aminotransferase class IV [Bryobacteraceae bacterium]